MTPTTPPEKQRQIAEMHHANVQCGAALQTDLHIKKLEDGIFVVLVASFLQI